MHHDPEPPGPGSTVILSTDAAARLCGRSWPGKKKSSAMMIVSAQEDVYGAGGTMIVDNPGYRPGLGDTPDPPVPEILR